MWELLRQRLMRSQSSWKGEFYSRVTMGNLDLHGFFFYKGDNVCGMCVLACISE